MPVLKNIHVSVLLIFIFSWFSCRKDIDEDKIRPSIKHESKVIYTNVEPDVNLVDFGVWKGSRGDSLLIDMDQDSIPEFIIYRAINTYTQHGEHGKMVESPVYVTVLKSTIGDSSCYFLNDPYTYYSEGEIIDSSSSVYTFSSFYLEGQSYSFLLPDAYIGIRVNNRNGYIHIGNNVINGKRALTIYRYALMDTDYAPIFAGQVE